MRSLRDPAHRLRAVQGAAEAPEHPYEAALWHLLHGRSEAAAASEPVLYALDLFAGDLERELMQAWLLAKATDAQVLQHLRVPEEVTRAYRHLFFDTTVFRDELAVLRWVKEYKPPANAPYGEQLLQNAVMLGVDYLAWMIGRGHAPDPETVQKTVMADAYFRGRMNRFHPLGSREAQLSHALMAQAFRASQALRDSTPPDVNQILIKLRYRDDTVPVDTEIKREDLLH